MGLHYYDGVPYGDLPIRDDKIAFDSTWSSEQINKVARTRILELNVPLSEQAILDKLKDYEGYECSGFFYNTNANVYCEFEGLYSGHAISGETIHFGYCHIRGIHNSQYSIDYYIDDEDGSAWYSKAPADYLKNEFDNIGTSISTINSNLLKVAYWTGVPVGYDSAHANFSDLSIPNNSTIVSVQQYNCLASLGGVREWGVSNNALYVNFVKAIEVNPANLVILYK